MISGYVTFSKQNNKKKSQEKVNKFECIKYFLMSKCQKNNINYHLEKITTNMYQMSKKININYYLEK